MSRDPSWSAADAAERLELMEAARLAGELPLIPWAQGIDFDLVFVEALGSLQLDSENIPGHAQVFLQQDTHYEFKAFGAESPALTLFDAAGFLIETTDIDEVDGQPSDPAGFDTIWNFSPVETGYFYLAVDWEDQEERDGLVSLSAFSADHLFAYGIIDENEYVWDPRLDDGNFYWDAGIVNRQGTEVEAVEAQLLRAYLGGLDRTPASSGFEFWLNRLEEGYELTQVAKGFINSNEFIVKADDNRDQEVSNDEFLLHMYEGVFGREPDAGGYAYWIDQLNSGAIAQEQAFLNMTQSNEYVLTTLAQVGDYFLI